MVIDQSVRAQRPSAGSGPMRQLTAFVAGCLAIAVVGAAAYAAGIAVGGVPFLLAIAPALLAAGIAWRAGWLRHLLHGLLVVPADRRWFLVLLLPVVATLLTIVAAIALGDPAEGLLTDLLPGIVIVPLVVLVPALTEELAWRGFALTAAMRITTPLRASLVLAIPWTLMHLPLFMAGGFNEGVELWPMLISIPSLSILLSWVYIRTGGSILMAGLFHAVFNGTVPLMSRVGQDDVLTGGIDPATGWAVRAVVIGGLAVAVVLLGGFRGRRFDQDVNVVLSAGDPGRGGSMTVGQPEPAGRA